VSECDDVLIIKNESTVFARLVSSDGDIAKVRLRNGRITEESTNNIRPLKTEVAVDGE